MFLAEKLGSQNPGGAMSESWPCLFFFKDEIALEVRIKSIMHENILHTSNLNFENW
jgi:hypothetical protein